MKDATHRTLPSTTLDDLKGITIMWYKGTKPDHKLLTTVVVS